MKGVVILVAHGIAHIYTKESPMELLLDLRTSARKVLVGEWLECSAYKSYVEWFRRIDAQMPTRVVEGKLQIETRVRVTYDSVTLESSEFGKVAYLGQKPPSLKMGHIYRCYVSRDPEQYANVYASLSVKWHVLPNSLKEDNVGIPSTHSPAVWTPQASNHGSIIGDVSKVPMESQVDQMAALAINKEFAPVSMMTGVVVGKRGRNYIIYSRIGFVQMIDKWKREADPLSVGQWISFKSKKLAPKKSIIDSNSWREIPPTYITKVEENDEVMVTVPCHVKGGKLFVEFLGELNGTEYKERIRMCRAVAWADDKGRFRWKMCEKQSIIPPRTDLQTQKPREDFTKDVDIQQWDKQVGNQGDAMKLNDSGIRVETEIVY